MSLLLATAVATAAALRRDNPRIAPLPSLVARSNVVASPSTLASPIAGVEDAPWTTFVRVLKTQPLGAVTESNALGMFEMKPRRLGDLGLMTDLISIRAESGRQVWTGSFIPPLTPRRFLTNPAMQYRALAASLMEYAGRIDTNEIERPSEMSLSGALAVLHRSGPGGLRKWRTNTFPETAALYQRANGIF